MIALPSVMLEVRFAPRKQKSGNYSLQVSLKSEQHGFTRERGLGMKVSPEQWDKKLMRFKETHRNKNYRQATRNKNRRLNTLEETITRVYDSKIISHEAVNLVEILDFVLQRNQNRANKSIPELLDDFVTESIDIHQLKPTTVVNWKGRQKKFKQFLQAQEVSTIPKMNQTKLIHTFLYELKTLYRLQSPTINYHLEFVIRFFNFLKQKDLIKINHACEVPRFKTTKRKRTPYLSQKQLNVLISLPDLTEMEQFVLRQFCFICYSGLSYSDFVRCKQDWFVTRNENQYLQFHRQKSGTLCLIPMLSELVAYQDVIKEQRYCKVYFNRILKRIGKKAEISFPLTSKIGRTTYAHFLLQEKKLRFEVISRILGHSSILMTQRFYADLGFAAIDAELAHLFEED